MKQQQRALAVGDLCLTVDSKHPANDGLRVVIVAITPGWLNCGRALPYTIQRIDGQMLPMCGPTNSPARMARCARSRLRRIDIDGKDDRDQLVAAPLDWLHITEDQLAALTRADEIDAAQGVQP